MNLKLEYYSDFKVVVEEPESDRFLQKIQPFLNASHLIISESQNFNNFYFSVDKRYFTLIDDFFVSIKEYKDFDSPILRLKIEVLDRKNPSYFRTGCVDLATGLYNHAVFKLYRNKETSLYTLSYSTTIEDYEYLKKIFGSLNKESMMKWIQHLLNLVK